MGDGGTQFVYLDLPLCLLFVFTERNNNWTQSSVRARATTLFSEGTGAMIDRNTLNIAGYICITVAVVGFIVNVSTFSVFISDKKLRTQVTTIIILFITAVNIVYNGVDLPLHATAFMNCK